MWIPAPLYRKMPALYAAGAVTTVLLFGIRSPGALSAVLLFGAAAATWRWRAKRPLIVRQRRPGGLPRKLSG
jgi:hypothetical protein